MVEAIEHGYPAAGDCREPRTGSSRPSSAREKVIVGVNGFVQEDEPPLPILYIDDTAADTQLARLERAAADAGQRRGARGRSMRLQAAARGTRQH